MMRVEAELVARFVRDLQFINWIPMSIDSVELLASLNSFLKPSRSSIGLSDRSRSAINRRGALGCHGLRRFADLGRGIGLFLGGDNRLTDLDNAVGLLLHLDGSLANLECLAGHAKAQRRYFRDAGIGE